MKISPINSFQVPQYKKEVKQNSSVKNFPQNNPINPLGYNDYLLSFGARVDKGLERFYDTNKDRMPQTVRDYIENLDDKSKYSPLEAQKNAYEKLESAQTIEDIKKAYPQEKLFENLINPIDSHATRGILNSIRENDELLKISDQGVLKDKSNLTVYLVKKIFLEDKTIEEINQDLDKDLDEDFKADFKFKNKDSQYIHTSTLNALGIKAPQFEYRQSLRYTRDGYSDLVGDKISEGQRAFWDSLSTEDRTARARVSAQKFEKWWTSLTKNQILDMLAEQKTELDMLKEFKKFQRAEKKKTPQPEENIEQEEITKPIKHTKVGSNKLSQDELFIMWASNTLKIYQEKLTEAEKDTLHIKRMQRLTQRWAQMTPEERTDYISKMKTGSDPLRYTMIDAWNHSTNLLKDLSQHLRENQIYKPADLLYSTQEFSEFQSKVMTEFWDNHPEYADQLGTNIQKSQEKIQKAISSGTFEELKKAIMRDKNQRIKEMEKFKQKSPIIEQHPTNKTPEYMIEFKNSYYKILGGQIKNLPQEYINDYFKSIEDGFSQEQIEAWTRNLNGQPLTEKDRELLIQISQTEPKNSKKINRAIEGALADTLYECTKNPQVYLLSHSDLKVALYQIDRGESSISIGSHKLNRNFEFNILKRKFDKNRIAFLYNKYKQDLSDEELSSIAHEYFKIKNDTPLQQKDYQPLIEYMKTYGKSLNIIFSEKSTYPPLVKAAMFSRFALNMPREISQNYQSLLLADGTIPFEKEEELQKLKFLLTKRFDFVPKIYMDRYLSEFSKEIRQTPNLDFTNIKKGCTKRTDPKTTAKLLILPKQQFQTINALRTLAMEEALADVLYDATGNIDVYKLQFEELCDNLEIFRMVKKYPTETRNYTSTKGDKISLTAVKRPNVSKLQQEYLEYINQIADWVNSDVKAGKGTFEDLLYILNPDENMPEKDDAVTKRIKLYGLNLK